jgi:sugar lactone lactonase YvrE
MGYSVDVAVPSANKLGEGPCWDDRFANLVWIDRPESRLCRWQPGADHWESVRMPHEMTAVMPHGAAGFVGASRDGIHLIDSRLTTVALLIGPLDEPIFRSNDGKADSRGRILVGSTDVVSPRESRRPGSLFSVSIPHEPQRVADDIGGPNGLGWSPEGDTLYHVDTPRSLINAFDYDQETGAVGNRRVLLSTEGIGGIPDGMTVDDDGCLWVAMYGGGQILRVSPNGRVLAKVCIPTELVTSVCFGPRGSRTVYVTTATRDSTGRMLGGRAPSGQAGSVFQVAVRIDGAPTHCAATGF